MDLDAQPEGSYAECHARRIPLGIVPDCAVS